MIPEDSMVLNPLARLDAKLAAALALAYVELQFPNNKSSLRLYSPVVVQA